MNQLSLFAAPESKPESVSRLTGPEYFLKCMGVVPPPPGNGTITVDSTTGPHTKPQCLIFLQGKNPHLCSVCAHSTPDESGMFYMDRKLAEDALCANGYYLHSNHIYSHWESKVRPPLEATFEEVGKYKATATVWRLDAEARKAVDKEREGNVFKL